MCKFAPEETKLLFCRLIAAWAAKTDDRCRYHLRVAQRQCVNTGVFPGPPLNVMLRRGRHPLP